MRIKIALLVLVLISPALAQNHIKPYRNKTAKQIANVTHLQKMDTTFFYNRVGDPIRDLSAALEARAFTPYDATTFSAAKDTARTRKRLFWIPPYYTTATLLGPVADSLLALDLRNNRFGFYGNFGARKWGFGSVFEADSVTNIRTMVDSVANFGRLKLGKGIYSIDTLALDNGITIQGTTIRRIRATDSEYYGTRLQSTATDTLKNFITSTNGGVWLNDLTLLGNSRQNGHGLFMYRDDGLNTTIGGLGVHRVASAFHGRDGFNFQGIDGVVLSDLESFGNKGYGIKITSPSGNTPAIGSTSGDGISVAVLGSRTRANSKGGIRVHDTNQVVLIGTQAIQDTLRNAYFSSSQRATLIGADFEFAKPPMQAGPYYVQNMVLEDERAFTMIGSYTGSLAYEAKNYRTDAGTDSTKIVDSALKATVNDYYVDWHIKNTTVGDGAEHRITGYNATTKTLTLADTLSGQDSSQTYLIFKRPDVGILARRLNSGVFINNSISGNSDTMFVADIHAHPIFIGANINFDADSNALATEYSYRGTSFFTVDCTYSANPKKFFYDLDLPATTNGYYTGSICYDTTLAEYRKVVGYNATTKRVEVQPAFSDTVEAGHVFKFYSDLNYLSIANDRISTDGEIWIKSNTKMLIQNSVARPTGSEEDSLVIRSKGAGVRISSNQVLDLNVGGESNIYMLRQVADNTTPEVRIYADVDTVTGSLNRRYLKIGPSNQPKSFLITNDADTVKLTFGLPLFISGNDSTERYIDIQSSTTSPVVPVDTGRVRLYARNNHLRYADVNGRNYPLGPRYGGAITSADSITFPTGTFFNITGKDSIKYIAPTYPGDEITLQFSDTLVVVDASPIGNLNLGSNMATAVTDVLKLILNAAGTAWLQVSRSDN